MVVLVRNTEKAKGVLTRSTVWVRSKNVSAWASLMPDSIFVMWDCIFSAASTELRVADVPWASAALAMRSSNASTVAARSSSACSVRACKDCVFGFGADVRLLSSWVAHRLLLSAPSLQR